MMTTMTNKHGKGKNTMDGKYIQEWYDVDHNERIRRTQGKLEEKTRYIWIMTKMNKYSETKTQLMQNIQGWHDDDRNKQIKTQRMENTYKDDTMAITMNGHGETGRENMICLWWKGGSEDLYCHRA
jgi:hypothetical protein